MITLHKFEGKNLSLLENECLEELNTSRDNIYIVNTEINGGLFKGKKIVLEAITKEEINKLIKDFFNELAKNMNLTINIEIRIDENNIKVLLISDNNNILIGKDGKTLNSLQVILKQHLKDLRKFGINILLDVSNYKQKRTKRLEYDIKELCKQVSSTNIEVKLDPMNSYERRIVHSIVSEFENLKSESFGEDPNRYTVIKVKDY